MRLAGQSLRRRPAVTVLAVSESAAAAGLFGGGLICSDAVHLFAPPSESGASAAANCILFGLSAAQVQAANSCGRCLLFAAAQLLASIELHWRELNCVEPVLILAPPAACLSSLRAKAAETEAQLLCAHLAA